jgi:hypothetical protein
MISEWLKCVERDDAEEDGGCAEMVSTMVVRLAD